jgi:hypothetical protein
VKKVGEQKRMISSWLTLYLRVVVPSFFLVCAVGSPVAIYARSTSPNRGFLAFMAFVLFCLGAGLVTLTTFWYRSVAIRNGHLIVSNYVRETSVPICNIRDVTELRLRGHPVTVHLKEPSAFGPKFTFLAKSRTIVDELKTMAGI